MARDASKENHLSRGLLAGPLKSVSTKVLVRWLVIAFCLLFWIVLLFVFVL